MAIKVATNGRNLAAVAGQATRVATLLQQAAQQEQAEQTPTSEDDHGTRAIVAGARQIARQIVIDTTELIAQLGGEFNSGDGGGSTGGGTGGGETITVVLSDNGAGVTIENGGGFLTLNGGNAGVQGAPAAMLWFDPQADNGGYPGTGRLAIPVTVPAGKTGDYEVRISLITGPDTPPVFIDPEQDADSAQVPTTPPAQNSYVTDFLLGTVNLFFEGPNSLYLRCGWTSQTQTAILYRVTLTRVPAGTE